MKRIKKMTRGFIECRYHEKEDLRVSENEDAHYEEFSFDVSQEKSGVEST